jgi:hypothetical protein
MNRIQRLVVLTAACLGSASLLMLLYWIVTASLESWGTALAGLVLCLLLASLVWLARRGRERLAAGLLTALLWLLVLGVSAGYGLGTPSVAGFVLPILLAGFVFGAGGGYGMAALASLAVWGIGAAAALGWYQPSIPPQESDLTFTAPMYTFLFVLTAVMVNSYTKQPEKGEFK